MDLDNKSVISVAHAREAYAQLISNSSGDIASGERAAQQFALSCAEFFKAISHTDASLADVAEGNTKKALVTEAEALRSLRHFLELLEKVEQGLEKQLQTALSSNASKAMEPALATGSWKAHFHTLANEIGAVRSRVENFITIDEHDGIPLIRVGDIKKIIDETGPIAADMSRAVCIMLLTFIDSAVATHRAFDKTFAAVEAQTTKAASGA